MCKYFPLFVLIFLLSCISQVKSFHQFKGFTSFFSIHRWKRYLSDTVDSANNIKLPETLEDLGIASGIGTHSKGFAVMKPKDSLPSNEVKLQELLAKYANDPNKRKVIEDTVKFPSEFVLKVIGIDQSESLVADVLSVLHKILNLDPPSNGKQLSSKELESSIKYSIKRSATNPKLISITVTPIFQNASQVYDSYEILGKDPRIKIIL